MARPKNLRPNAFEWETTETARTFEYKPWYRLDAMRTTGASAGLAARFYVRDPHPGTGQLDKALNELWATGEYGEIDEYMYDAGKWILRGTHRLLSQTEIEALGFSPRCPA